jgi:hypothetical protein
MRFDFALLRIVQTQPFVAFNQRHFLFFHSSNKTEVLNVIDCARLVEISLSKKKKKKNFQAFQSNCCTVRPRYYVQINGN